MRLILSFAIVYLLIFFDSSLSLKELIHSVNVAYRLNHGNWIEHRGHGSTNWLSWLPNAFNDGFSDLYLFENTDICRCSKQKKGIDVVFLGGDTNRIIQMSFHQMFTKFPFEPRKSPTDCDSVYIDPNTPCGHLVTNPFTGSFCNGTISTWSINFDKVSKPMDLENVISKRIEISCNKTFDLLFVIDPESSGIISFNQFKNIFIKQFTYCNNTINYLTILHNSEDMDDSNEDAVSETNLLTFKENSLPFINFHGIYENFTKKYNYRMVHDINSYKHLQTQLLLNSICDVYPDQSMLFGSKVGSFLLKEIKVYPEGMLLRSGNSKEFFLIKNGTKHAFPNWDTFVSGGYDAKNVKAIPPEEWEDIPLGSSLPPCIKC